MKDPAKVYVFHRLKINEILRDLLTWPMKQVHQIYAIFWLYEEWIKCYYWDMYTLGTVSLIVHSSCGEVTNSIPCGADSVLQ